MLIQLYLVHYEHWHYIDCDQKCILYKAIATHNGSHSANRQNFISDITTQIISLAKTFNVNFEPNSIQNLWPTNNFRQVFDENNNYIYECKCGRKRFEQKQSGFTTIFEVIYETVNIRWNAPIFLSNYTMYLLFENKRKSKYTSSNSTYSYKEIDVHEYHKVTSSMASYNYHGRNPNLGYRIYNDNDALLVHSKTSPLALLTCWKIKFDFPFQKKWHTDCLIVLQ